MDELNWKELEQIPIPEGLEERLEKKIDEWEESEKLKVKSEKSEGQLMMMSSEWYSLPGFLGSCM